LAYIDYSKAFDSVPHRWLIKVLEVFKVCPKIQKVLASMMTTWRTKLMLNGQDLGDIDILRGIFQGDSLSPLWFCLAMNPLSFLLNETQYGYKINKNGGKKLNHLLFMDDLKLYCESREKLKSLISTVETFSRDINMVFGLGKCAFVSIKKGITQNQDEVFLGIQELEEKGVYKYLGLSQNAKIDHTQLKIEFATKYNTRLNKIFNTKLAGSAIIDAINSWAVPILTYSFGIVKWTDTDLDNLDRKTRTLMTKFRFLHPNSSVIRLYLPRKEGGRGLINIKQMCRKQVLNMRTKLKESEEEIIKIAAEEDAGYTPLYLSEETLQEENVQPQTIQNWKSKQLHGKFPLLLEDPSIDTEASLQWLKQGHLHPETEGFILAIQDRVIRTKNYEKFVLKTNVVDRCRKCGCPGESIEHITAGCSALANNAYLSRHNQLAKLIHRQLAIKYGMLGIDTPPYYKYSPVPVLESVTHIMYWDRPIITDHTVAYNRPDIVVVDKMKATARIIDIAVPLTYNIKATEAEKIRKYEDLAIEIKNIWKLSKVTIHPIVMSVEGVMSKNFRTNLENIEIPKTLYKTAQKLTILQTCHIVRKFLN
jgi:hypothetical protein